MEELLNTNTRVVVVGGACEIDSGDCLLVACLWAGGVVAAMAVALGDL
jgi:hypothetical protein